MASRCPDECLGRCQGASKALPLRQAKAVLGRTSYPRSTVPPKCNPPGPAQGVKQKKRGGCLSHLKFNERSGFTEFPNNRHRKAGFTCVPETPCLLCRSRQSGGGGLRSLKQRFAENRFLALETDDRCLQPGTLYGRGLKCLELLHDDQCVPVLRELPFSISCRNFRDSIRSCFGDLPAVAELSVKTCQKLIDKWCDECSFCLDNLREQWEEERLKKVKVSEWHLRSFEEMLRENVPRGWNRTSYPYIPNGSASLTKGRRQGGNWNQEPFSEECRIEQVISAGKPRIVTLYSSHNLSVLTPLHKSLFRDLARGGWLLVGPPTCDDVSNLNGEGPYISNDYIGATDNFKTDYVRVAIEVLISRAEGLEEEQIRCLRAMPLTISGVEAGSGQPMGSPMSFPLLCLVNKTIVDLAMADLLESGEITFSEWSRHRCLINGDDLLIREPKEKSHLASRLRYHAQQVGPRVNLEKTMVSSELAEINSTVFDVSGRARLQPKTNVRAFYMSPGEQDVLGFALRSCRHPDVFRRIVRANAHILRRQQGVSLVGLPIWAKAICRRDRKIRKALTEPISFPEDPVRNFFNVEPRPLGYDLTREEETRVIEDRVVAIRPCVLELYRKKRKKEEDSFVMNSGCIDWSDLQTWKSTRDRKVNRPRRSWKELVTPTNSGEDDNILTCLARAWETKAKRAKLVEDLGGTQELGETFDLSCYDGRGRTPLASRLSEAIKGARTAADLRTNRVINHSGVAQQDINFMIRSLGFRFQLDYLAV